MSVHQLQGSHISCKNGHSQSIFNLSDPLRFDSSVHIRQLSSYRLCQTDSVTPATHITIVNFDSKLARTRNLKLWWE